MASSLLPVTAICPCADSPLVFAACGSLLELYHCGVRVWSQPAFEDQTIHGITCSPSSEPWRWLIIWGGSRVRAAGVHWSTFDILFQQQAIFLDDWLLHVALPPATPSYSRRQAVGLTAHNKLLRFDITIDPSQPSAVLDHVHLAVAPLSEASNSLLYVAHLRWLTPTHVLIVAGSAFGDLLVWTCNWHGAVKTPPHSTWHHLCEAHEGAVFGIDVHHEEDSLLAATCSDERTIKVWDISAALTILRRRSGRLNATPPSNDALPAAPLVAACWAHASRIWNVSFLSAGLTDSGLPVARLISAGEDGTCHHHSFSLSGQESSQAPNSSSSSVLFSHAGKNVWSLTVAKMSKGSVVTTGGADGAVVSYACTSEYSVLRGSNASTSLADILQRSQALNLPPASMALNVLPPQSVTRSSIARDVVRSATWLDTCSAILCITNSGSLLIGRALDERVTIFKHDPSAAFDWQRVDLSSRLAGYSVVCSIQGEAGLALFAGVSNDVFLFNVKTAQLDLISRTNGKVSRIFVTRAMSAVSSNDTSASFYYVAPLMRQDSHVTTLHKFTISKEKRLISVESIAELQVRGQVTAFSLEARGSRSLSICLGNRHGYLSLYEVDARTNGLVDPLASKHLHQDSITSIQNLPTLSTTNGEKFTLTTSRDSTLAVLRVSPNFALEVYHSSIPPCGPLIEGAFLSKRRNHLILYGFRGYDFIVYDETIKRELAVIKCGGIAKAWSFHPQSAIPGSSGGCLLWTHTNDLHWAPIDLYDDHDDVWPKLGGHGREIKTCAVSPSLTFLDNNHNQLIATGAEDTDIRLFARKTNIGSEQEADFRCLAILKRHNTGIQHLQWSDDGMYLFSSGGLYEFCVWRIRPLGVFGAGVVCDFAVKEPAGSDLQDLRITGFEARCSSLDPDCFDICIALSDSNIKVYRYSCAKKSWTFRWAGSYSEICLTQARFLWPDCQSQILAATSDGRIVFWDEKRSHGAFSYDYILERRVHQSLVKALARLPLYSKATGTLLAVLAVTGSDDNSLAFTLIHVSDLSTTSKSLAEQKTETLLIPRAHGASVSALTIIPGAIETVDSVNERLKTIRIVTGGNDQRLKTWDISLSADLPSISSLTVRKVANIYTPVADIGDLDILPVDEDLTQRHAVDVLVCGVGMQSVEIPLLSS